MALSDYTPTLMWWADSLSDLDTPTGTTVTNPGALGNPTQGGSASDYYYDFDGTNDGVMFTPGTPVNEVGTGDITLVMKARYTGGGVLDIVMQNYDGAGSAGTSHGYQIRLESTAAPRVSLLVPPRGDGFRLEGSSNSITLNTDFLVAFKRSSGSWTMWIDDGAATGMSRVTPITNAIGSSAISSCGDIAFGSDRTGAEPSSFFVYWFLGFDAAISDTDIQLSTWVTEASLKAVWDPTGPTITDVNTTESWTDGDTGLVITGTGFV